MKFFLSMFHIQIKFMGVFYLTRLKFFQIFSRPVHIENVSSINLRYISKNVLINGYINFLLKWSMEILAYEGAQIIPMARPFICKQFLQLKIKLFSVSINAKNVVITFVEAVYLEYFSKDVLTDLIPSAFKILVFNDFTSRKTRYELSGTKSIWLIFL